MGKAGIILVTVLALFSGKKISVVNMEQLQHATAGQANDTLYIVNFWATWCKPCVAEMPYFEAASQKFQQQKVKVVFVSLNSLKEMTQVQKMVNDKQIKAEVCLLNAGNPNVWIDKVDKSWSGAMPATVMYRKGKKTFFREGEFTQHELDSVIQTKI